MAIDTVELKREANARAEDLLAFLLPNGKRDGMNFRAGDVYGSPGESFSYSLDKHVWKDFATGDGGDIITLIERNKRLGFKEASEWLQDWLGVTLPSPVPKNLPKPTAHKYGNLVARYTYRDQHGAEAYQVHRYDGGSKGKKQFMPCYTGADGKTVYKYPPTGRILYNLDRIADARVIVVVEGEKCADYGNTLSVNGNVFVTWPGGASTSHMVKWGALQGKKVLLWPDNDTPGKKGMRYVGEALQGIVGALYVIKIPEGMPEGWDIADAIADLGDIPKFIRENSESYEGSWLQRWSEERVIAELPAPIPEGLEVVSGVVAASPKTEDGIDTLNERSTRKSPKGRYWQALGYDDDGRYYIFSYETWTVLSFRPSMVSKYFLFQIQPKSFWDLNYPGGRGGISVDDAVGVLLDDCHSAGLFDPSSVRGLGMWWDKGRYVVHCGDTILSADGGYGLNDFDSEYVYIRRRRVRMHLDKPLEDDEAMCLLDICRELTWERPIFASMLAGWCVVAPVCGALKWRPHIWLTAAAGAGKSTIMRDIVKPCLGGFEFYVKGRSTAAGIRQELTADARPVIFDEAENEGDIYASIDGVLELARDSSTDDDAKIAKGTITGKSIKYDIKSCFLFSAINTSVISEADTTRITLLSLEKNMEENAAEQYEILEKMIHDTLTPEYCERLISRTIKNVDVLRHNAEIFKAVITRRLGSARYGDQLGTLMAGAYLLHSTEKVDANFAQSFLGDFNVVNKEALPYDEDHYKCLSTIMQHTVLFRGKNTTTTYSLAELVKLSALTGSDTESTEADRMLRIYGITWRENMLFVANRNDNLRKILRGTAWSKEWGKALKRIPGADNYGGRPVSFNNVKTCVTRVPFDIYSDERVTGR